MSRGKTESYSIKVIGQSESDFSGARPSDIKELIEKPGKDIMSLIYQTGKAEIDLCVQSGDTAGAWAVVEKIQKASHEYANPLNTFQKDRQNGLAPFIGAQSIVASLRDSAKMLFPGKVLYDKKGSKMPAKEHFRKAVFVKPNHIFMYRPGLDGKKIEEVDEIQGQQPSKEVRGFARYETIMAPFQFEFTITVSPKGVWAITELTNPDSFMEMLKMASILGIGGRRGVGYGQWQIIKTEFI